jgi:serine/threonine-protein kinase RsbW
MQQSAVLSDTAFELDGDLEELERLMELVDHFCRTEGMDGEAAFELTLVLEELFTNAVRHGGCEGMKGAVAVRLRHAGEGQVGVEYRDRGRPFDPMTAPPPDLHTPLEDRKPGGLGIHLVKQIMHDLQYQRTGEWNRITMRREPRQEAKSI